MAKYKLIKLKSFEAHGGLSRDFLDNDPVSKQEGYSSTKEGRYVVHSIGKHVSAGRWLLSTVPWGTPILFNQSEHILYVQKGGKMIKLRNYNSQWGGYSEKDLYDELLQIYQRYYKSYYGMAFPNTWIFNDFGHVTIKYFKDTNANFIMDSNEKIQSDFIHTTQIDEAITAYNNRVETKFARPISLSNSHGCIHVKPQSIDEIINNGYLSRGSNIEIHTYATILLVPNVIEIPNANPKKLFEVHFFPLSDPSDKNSSGKGELVVYTINKN